MMGHWYYFILYIFPLLHISQRCHAYCQGPIPKSIVIYAAGDLPKSYAQWDSIKELKANGAWANQGLELSHTISIQKYDGAARGNRLVLKILKNSIADILRTQSYNQYAIIVVLILSGQLPWSDQEISLASELYRRYPSLYLVTVIETLEQTRQEQRTLANKTYFVPPNIPGYGETVIRDLAWRFRCVVGTPPPPPPPSSPTRQPVVPAIGQRVSVTYVERQPVDRNTPDKIVAAKAINSPYSHGHYHDNEPLDDRGSPWFCIIAWIIILALIGTCFIAACLICCLKNKDEPDYSGTPVAGSVGYVYEMPGAPPDSPVFAGDGLKTARSSRTDGSVQSGKIPSVKLGTIPGGAQSAYSTAPVSRTGYSASGMDPQTLTFMSPNNQQPTQGGSQSRAIPSVKLATLPEASRLGYSRGPDSRSGYSATGMEPKTLNLPSSNNQQPYRTMWETTNLPTEGEPYDTQPQDVPDEQYYAQQQDMPTSRYPIPPSVKLQTDVGPQSYYSRRSTMQEMSTVQESDLKLPTQYSHRYDDGQPPSSAWEQIGSEGWTDQGANSDRSLEISDGNQNQTAFSSSGQSGSGPGGPSMVSRRTQQDPTLTYGGLDGTQLQTAAPLASQGAPVGSSMASRRTQQDPTNRTVLEGTQIQTEGVPLSQGAPAGVSMASRRTQKDPTNRTVLEGTQIQTEASLANQGAPVEPSMMYGEPQQDQPDPSASAGLSGTQFETAASMASQAAPAEPSMIYEETQQDTSSAVLDGTQLQTGTSLPDEDPAEEGGGATVLGKTQADPTSSSASKTSASKLQETEKLDDGVQVQTVWEQTQIESQPSPEEEGEGGGEEQTQVP